VSRRRKLAERYLRQLPEGARPISAGEGVHHAYHLFVVNVHDRDRVRSELAAAGIDTGTHYPLPIHLMDGYRFLGAPAGSLPQTEALAGSILSLPMYPELSLASVDRVCEELTRILG
jgi:dTDP-3-amino-2,3,6-trideoxy-4-keto-D-glucose/dTDP-3-amino-3,4,6-trideoxy-alpha-D-glucose/dTDP-2,6-dideoxy-D-kanosamine transaminase